ncbi:MAG: MarR family transcriptional regulator [Clostridia bacterium]|nr:MarR family transcriptional regulator [Clostridia bacterium]
MDKRKFIAKELSKTNNLIRRNWQKCELKKQMDDATGRNGWIIGFLADNDDREIFQRDIEDEFSIRRSTVSSMIQLMEKKGFVTRESVDYDARLKKLVLTPKAREMNSKMLSTLEKSEEKLREGISSEELELFFSILEKIQKNAE